MRLIVMRVFNGSDGCGVPEYVTEVRSIEAWENLKLESEPDMDGNDWLYVATMVRYGKQVGHFQRVPDGDNKYRRLKP